jgi:hypothetical protein
MRIWGRGEKAISFFGCLLVILSLVAPRLIVHRHTDADASSANSNALAQDALAEHCARFHRTLPNSIDLHEMHLHWGFSFSQGELPDDSPTDRGLMIAGSSTPHLSFDPCQDVLFTDGWGGNDGSTSLSLGSDRLLGSRYASADFKRVIFGVWNI